jgi:hypothetical protein
MKKNSEGLLIFDLSFIFLGLVLFAIDGLLLSHPLVICNLKYFKITIGSVGTLFFGLGIAGFIPSYFKQKMRSWPKQMIKRLLKR